MSKGKKLFFFLGFLVGFLILMYPGFADPWNRWRNSRLASGYEQQVAQIDTAEKDKILEDARVQCAAHRE